jgi:two-component system sensor histidine kinase ChiS
MTTPLAFVIEDDENQATIFTKALQAAGYQVNTIEDGAKALEALSREKPYLVLLDLQLPNVSGNEILEFIRATPALEKTIVLLTTAAPHMADPIAEKSDFVLLKPISYTQLRDIVARLK